jgi:membrane protease subunit HflC
VSPLRRTLGLAGAVLIALAVWSCLVVVDVTEYGVVSRFGRITRVIAEPGLYVKGPYPVDRLTRLDRRLLVFRPATAEFLSEDKKNLILHGLVTWRIADPARFLARVGSRAAAEERIGDVVQTNLGAVVGSVPSSALVGVDGHDSRFHQVMERIARDAHQRALADFGIDLVDIRLRQVGLPEQNRTNVFARMQAERGKIAMAYRSEGEREFKKVVAEADREKTRILAEAYREAERTKGEGDAEAMRIYAEAFGRNPQFYKFRRTLQAYEKILDGNATVFLPADAEIFRILESQGHSAASRSDPASRRERPSRVPNEPGPGRDPGGATRGGASGATR